ncbi:MAG: PDZ domain-containing protein [Mariniblastus sp.]
MKFGFKSTIALGICTLAGLVSTTQQNRAQENEANIVIVNQDGEPVGELQEKAIAPATPTTPPTGVTARAGVSIQSKDGKIVVKDADGTTVREIDTMGAKSIIVNRSAKSVSINGENQTQTFGKAIIIGPDGERQEITLGTPIDGLTQLGWEGLRGTMKVDRVNNTFMIGVHCEPVDEAMRSQLGLESGLIIEQVMDDTPAANSGVQKHDILMFADDRELKTNTDLSEMVQTAGKEKTKITFTAIRSGKEISLEVTPAERPVSDATLDPAFGHMLKIMPDLGAMGGMDMKFRHLGPGVIVSEGDFFEAEKSTLKIEEEMKRMREDMESFRRQMQEDFGKELGK